jgi:hypothetical protein
MSTRERIRDDAGQDTEVRRRRRDAHEHIARLFGNARELLDVAGPVVARTVSSDSEKFLDSQRQSGGQ